MDHQYTIVAPSMHRLPKTVFGEVLTLRRGATRHFVHKAMYHRCTSVLPPMYHPCTTHTPVKHTDVPPMRHRSTIYALNAPSMPHPPKAAFRGGVDRELERQARYRRCATNLPPLYHRCTTDTPPKYHRCAIDGPSLRHQCIITVPRMRHQCNINVISVASHLGTGDDLWERRCSRARTTSGVPPMRHRCATDVSPMHH